MPSPSRSRSRSSRSSASRSSTGAATLLAAAAVYGFAYGAVTSLMPAIVADFFGPAHAGSLVGLMFGIAGPTSPLGPVNPSPGYS